MTDKEEEDVCGFTGDIKNFLRQKDFDSALILVSDLRKYIERMKRNMK